MKNTPKCLQFSVKFIYLLIFIFIFITDTECKVDETKNSSASFTSEKSENSRSGAVGGKRGKNKKRRGGQEFTHSWMVGALKAHTGTVLDMKFSSDGKFLASCAEGTFKYFQTYLKIYTKYLNSASVTHSKSFFSLSFFFFFVVCLNLGGGLVFSGIYNVTVLAHLSIHLHLKNKKKSRNRKKMTLAMA